MFKTKAIQHSNEHFGAFDVKIFNTIKEIIDTNTKSEISHNTRALAQRRKVTQALQSLALAVAFDSKETPKQPKSPSSAHVTVSAQMPVP